MHYADSDKTTILIWNACELACVLYIYLILNTKQLVLKVEMSLNLFQTKYLQWLYVLRLLCDFCLVTICEIN